ncbi:GNAT family N-acetyltransferase [Conexibacter sp. S30A1]|uniref:GNAT family N-acetyltransferase n=1 Tax=Conexibacter sp. S30A1 TaxID=2937800 RepID=UPI00200BC690|nr:GNAT family N-acetyltransferase [Conexibacter sp. S30A1]
MSTHIRSLVWSTDIDVLAADHELIRRHGYWFVRSPSNPTYWWGNLLLFDAPPQSGDGARWQTLFAREFAAHPEVRHCTVAWDRTDGELGASMGELVARGFELERTAGLIATPTSLREHPRANREAQVRALDPDADEELWAAVIGVQMATAEEFELGAADDRDYHLAFRRGRQRALRELFRAGRGGWYVALIDGQVAGSLGIVVTQGRARYQTVDTVAAFRRLGVASRLVHAAAQSELARQRIDHLVIAADPDYHALGLYESLGFTRVEEVVGALRKPGPAA